MCYHINILINNERYQKWAKHNLAVTTMAIHTRAFQM
jgi:hypothetical protein